MNIKEELEKLVRTKAEIDYMAEELKEKSKKLAVTIRKLQKKSAEVEELLDNTPVIDDEK